MYWEVFMHLKTNGCDLYIYTLGTMDLQSIQAC